MPKMELKNVEKSGRKKLKDEYLIQNYQFCLTQDIPGIKMIPIHKKTWTCLYLGDINDIMSQKIPDKP